MIAKRLDLWRLSNFAAASGCARAEDVYLFHGVAHDNPADQRLFALAEVRDLTPVQDRERRVVALPAAGTDGAAGAGGDARGAGQVRPEKRPAAQPDRAVCPSAMGCAARLVARAGTLAGAAGGRRGSGEGRCCGCGFPDGLAIAVLDVEGLGGGVTVRERPPGQRADPAADAVSAEAVARPQVWCAVPVRDRADADPAGRGRRALPARGSSSSTTSTSTATLVPVDRPYGQNTANIVVGPAAQRHREDARGNDPSRAARRPDPRAGQPGRAGVPAHHRRARPRRARCACRSSGSRCPPARRSRWTAAPRTWTGSARCCAGSSSSPRRGGEVNVVVTGINVGAQPYWNAEATMLMHTRGILVMTPTSAMVLTGKQALDFSGGVSAEDNFGIGGFDRIMGPNGQGQYWAPTLRRRVRDPAAPLRAHLRRAGRSVPAAAAHHRPGRPGRARPRRTRRSPATDMATVGDVFSAEHNAERKKPFDIRSVMRAVTDADSEPLERWAPVAGRRDGDRLGRAHRRHPGVPARHRVPHRGAARVRAGRRPAVVDLRHAVPAVVAQDRPRDQRAPAATARSSCWPTCPASTARRSRCVTGSSSTAPRSAARSPTSAARSCSSWCPDTTAGRSWCSPRGSTSDSRSPPSRARSPR